MTQVTIHNFTWIKNGTKFFKNSSCTSGTPSSKFLKSLLFSLDFTARLLRKKKFERLDGCLYLCYIEEESQLQNELFDFHFFFFFEMRFQLNFVSIFVSFSCFSVKILIVAKSGN